MNPIVLVVENTVVEEEIKSKSLFRCQYCGNVRMFLAAIFVITRDFKSSLLRLLMCCKFLFFSGIS